MRADTWGEVAEVGADFVSAFWSRVRNYSHAERERRAKLDVERRERIREAVQSAMDAFPWRDDDEPSDDATHVEAWMAENGFTARTDTSGIDEQTEVAISAATEAFRARLQEIFGHDDFAFHVEVGLDSGDEDA